MKPVFMLPSPHSTRRLFKTIERGLPGARAAPLLCLSLPIAPEAVELARIAERDETSKWEQKAGRPRGRWYRAFRRLVLQLQYSGWRRMFSAVGDGHALCWNGADGRRRLFHEAARRSGLQTWYLELCPLPGFLAIDPQGINAGNSLPRDNAYYLAWQARQAQAAAGRDIGPGQSRASSWRHLRDRLALRKEKRSQDRPASDTPDQSLPERFIFCPLQVPTDTQLTEYGDWIAGIEHLIEVCSQAARHLPRGWKMLVKEHPSSPISFAMRIQACSHAGFEATTFRDTYRLIDACEAVVTVNSSVGLQAFLFDKPVIVLGEAFYGFEPLVTRIRDQQALNVAMATPESLCFDDASREAFMTYLTTSYLLPARLQANPCIDAVGLNHLRNLFS